jgi:hypothetical protein
MGLAVRDAMQGRVNNVHEVTLDAGATYTVWTDDRFTPESVVLLVPHTANAAAATGLYCVAGAGQVTIYHDANSSTDRTFGAVVFG